jgi:hypothetical protein
METVWLWWVLSFAAFALTVFFVENEFYVATVVESILIVLGLQYIFKLNVFEWVLSNPLTILFSAVVYVIIGIIYGIFRWKLFVHDKRQEFDAYVESDSFKTLLEIKFALTQDSFDKNNPKMVAYAFELFGGYRRAYPLQVKEWKARITGWTAYWIPSLFWFFVNDPLRRLYNYIYTSCSKLLQKISDNSVSDLTRG